MTASDSQYRHARLLDHGRGDWAMTIARRYLYETADAVRLEALAGGAWTPLADLVAKLQREERYPRCISGRGSSGATAPGRPRDRLLSALRALAWDAGTVFTPLDAERHSSRVGVLARPMADLEHRWRAGIARTFEGARAADASRTDRAFARGRMDHGDDFRWLWGEFTAVRRSDPGATW
jgi:ring-1,2-phenylacetyl-CoA epoxidase subunit PaaC